MTCRDLLPGKLQQTEIQGKMEYKAEKKGKGGTINHITFTSAESST